jgi:TRAP-type C4-dicarboxylate transport system substrate-binding protein
VSGFRSIDICHLHRIRYTVQKYLSFTNHKYECKVFLISENTWKKLSPEYQKVVNDAAKKFAIENREMFAQEDKELQEDLVAKGMSLNTPNLEPFRKATASVYDEWRKTLGTDLVNKVIAAAQAK